MSFQLEHNILNCNCSITFLSFTILEILGKSDLLFSDFFVRFLSYPVSLLKL